MTMNEMLKLVPEEDRDKDMIFLDIYTGQRTTLGIEGARDSYILVTTDANEHFCKDCKRCDSSKSISC